MSLLNMRSIEKSATGRDFIYVPLRAGPHLTLTEVLLFGHPSSLCACTRIRYSTLHLGNDDIQAGYIGVCQGADHIHRSTKLGIDDAMSCCTIRVRDELTEHL